MPIERDPLSKLLLECDGHAKYTGKKRPLCDNRKGCIACWQTYHKYIDDHRPKMSKDFKEFYDYICKYKRLMQSLGFKDPVYQFVAAIEKTIRTGDYRHKVNAFDLTFEAIAEMDREKPRRKRLNPMQQLFGQTAAKKA